MNMKMLTILVLIAIAVVSILVYLYSFNIAQGQQEQPFNGSSRIALNPLFTPDDNVRKLFQKEFGEMLKTNGYDD
jgi:hypothetical protein